MSSGRRTPAAVELALFFRSLSGLLRTEVPLGRALALTARDLGGRLGRATGAMAGEVDDGSPLAAALERRPEVFPRIYVALVAAGAAAGDLPAALDEIADHAARRGEVARRVRRALTYPLVAGAVAFAVALGIVLFVLPRQWELAETVTGDAGSGALAAGTGLGVLALLFVSAFVFTRVWGPMDVPVAWRIPVLGPIRCLADRTLLAGTLALLLRREVPLPRALALAADAGGSRVLAERLGRAARAADGGDALGALLDREELLPPSLAWLVAASEERSDAATGLSDVAAICRDRLDRAIDRLVVLVRPLGELVVGIAVFLLAVSFLLPMLDYATGAFGS